MTGCGPTDKPHPLSSWLAADQLPSPVPRRDGDAGYKTLIGPSLRSRIFGRQKVEAAVAVRCTNRFTALGMPRSIRIA